MHELSRDISFELTQELYDNVTANAKLYNKTESPTLDMIKRCECELYELYLMSIGRWKKFDGWQVDGISDEYGNVDVKCINIDKPWWNINKLSMRNICRQHNVIDNYYFISFTEHRDPACRLEVGQTVAFNFIGVIPYENIMKQIQCSFRDGHYIDTRRAKK